MGLKMKGSERLPGLNTSEPRVLGVHGQLLVGAVLVLAVLMIFVPLLVQWAGQESRWTVKQQKSSVIFALADAAVDRGTWKLKSATSTFAAASVGTVIAGYNFDAIYTDIEGGTYRLRFSSGPSANQVTILAEARDNLTKQVRAVRGVFENVSLPGPMMSGGSIGYAKDFECAWGPVYAKGNINISGWAATKYYPRKYSKQVVTGIAANPRDTNGLTPPNTDNIEWWSDYNVPDLPILDFTTMRASATATSTLNFRTNIAAGPAIRCTGFAATHGTCQTGSTPHTTAANHNPAGTTCHFFDPNDHASSKLNQLWYWDNDVIFSGDMRGSAPAGCHRLGLYGTVIVRGNMTVDSGDCYAYVGPVPANAWREYAKLTTAANDTAAVNEYPADNGFQTNRLTFNHGGETWTGGPPSGNTDVGFRGFVYIGGDLTLNSLSDVSGTMWVVGNTINNDVSGERVNVFYEGNNPNIPLLNVVLARVTWDEIPASNIAW
jgi:hypothetical protein